MRRPAAGFLTLEVTERYERALERLEPTVRKQARRRAELLFGNPAHPSLQTHQIKPDRYYWEAYVNRGDRIIYVQLGSHLVLVDVVKHDDIGRYGRGPRER